MPKILAAGAENVEVDSVMPPREDSQIRRRIALDLELVLMGAYTARIVPVVVLPNNHGFYSPYPAVVRAGRTQVAQWKKGIHERIWVCGGTGCQSPTSLRIHCLSFPILRLSTTIRGVHRLSTPPPPFSLNHHHPLHQG